MRELSIIVPVYNGAADNGRLLRECIGSIVCQKGVDWELIIVNDGSTDSTGDILSELSEGDDRIKVIYQRNQGQATARNTGIDQSRGKYISFVDADDMLVDGALCQLYDIIRRATDAPDIVIGKYFTALPYAPKQFTGQWHQNDPKAFLIESLYQIGGHIAAWSMLIRREICQANHFTDGLYYEDLDWFPRLYFNAKSIISFDIPFYYYRTNPLSFIHTWSERRLDVLKATENVEHFVSQNLPEALPAARDRRLSANFNIFILASANGRYDVALQCWDLIRRYRWRSMTDRCVRWKNKVGILLSFTGRRMTAWIAHLFVK